MIGVIFLKLATVGYFVLPNLLLNRLQLESVQVQVLSGLFNGGLNDAIPGLLVHATIVGEIFAPLEPTH